jgi:hypothetical protein
MNKVAFDSVAISRRLRNDSPNAHFTYCRCLNQVNSPVRTMRLTSPDE